MKTILYIPIRKTIDYGTEWINTSCADDTLDGCRINIVVLQRQIPHWHEANPVVRIARFECVEVEEGS